MNASSSPKPADGPQLFCACRPREEPVVQVSMAELQRRAKRLVGKRLHASVAIEQTAEGLFLVHDAPGEKARVRVVFVGLGPSQEAQRREWEGNLQKLETPAFRGRAVMTLQGRLRVASGTPGADFQLEVERCDSFGPFGRPFEGLLTEGECYRAAIETLPEGQFKLQRHLHLPNRVAGRIEWVNLRRLPKLRRTPVDPPGQYVVFRVLAKEVVPFGPGRWNATFRCEIYRTD